MISRSIFALSLALILHSVSTFANNPGDPLIFREEPVVRVGLTTNARSVSITTTDVSLTAVSPNEAPRELETARIVVAPRAYRPPVIENFYFEITGIATTDEATEIAADAKEATGEVASVTIDEKNSTFRVRFGAKKESLTEASEYKEYLAEKGFDDVEIITERIVVPSAEAVALSEQLKSNNDPKNEIRSLVKPTASTQPAADSKNPSIDPNLKEILVSGGTKFSSFKPIAFGSTNERAVPVRFNGKAYRGKIEVFVNSRGSLTVVNVVPIEDYLYGVVPNELGFREIEAQKAQAVAARTYAMSKFGQFANEGFDVLPTTRSQVYKGHSSETSMGTQAVNATRGIVAMYNGKPIRAMYTSTCGGRTEDVKLIYTDYDAPYLKGVECSLESREYFNPLLIKSSREMPKVSDEEKIELVRIASQFAVSGFVMPTNRFTDEWFEAQPSPVELKSWVNQLAVRFAKPFPVETDKLVKPVEFANFLAGMVYPEGQTDVLMSESDIDYHLSFNDGNDVDKDKRANVAMLFRDGWLSLTPDFNFHPHRAMSRSRLLRQIHAIYSKKKWLPAFQTGVAKTSVDGKLVLRSGKTDRQLLVRPDVFLFRQFGELFYQVKETAVVGGESVSFQTNATGEVTYLEVKPTQTPTIPESMSPFTNWNATLSASAMQSRLARYVRGFGTLYDVKVKASGYSRRATELEIIGSNGRFSLVGGKIRSALKLKEQLFVMNKRYDSNGRVVTYNFTGRGWGHGIGLCQYGTYGLAKMGVKYDTILKHYYSGIDLVKNY
jgi:stage II sporulation protein D